MVVWFLAVLLLASGCFDPGLPATSCANGFCPTGLVCNADDRCVEPGGDGDGDGDGDAAIPGGPFSEPELVTEITASPSDVEISGDDLEIVINVRGTKFFSIRDDPGEPFPALEEIVGLEGSDPELSSDRTTLWLSVSITSTDNDIEVASRASPGDDWGAQSVEPDLVSPATDFGLTVTADGQVGALASDRAGSAGDQDLWEVRRAGGGWSTPVNISAVNTSVFEGNPELSPDGLELFFDREVNGGDRKLFVARRGSLDQEFSEPTRVDELNADGAQDHDLSITDDGATVYFISNRGGSSRIYRATR